jgi:RNA polymerase sigma-70 factor (ECF subfamily)
LKTNRNIDANLVKEYKAGDKNALAALVQRWHKLFCDKAYWLVKDKDVAKDIAQESWSIIIEKIDSLNDPKQFKYWAYRIIINKSTDWLRLQSKKQQQIVNYEVELDNDERSYDENEYLKQKLLKAIIGFQTIKNQWLNYFTCSHIA